jgi:hypothetical protein
MSRKARTKSVDRVRTLKALNRPLKALILLALLLLASAPIAQLVHFAEAQGAGAGSTTGAEARGALYVYKDLSASLELHVTQKLEEPVVESWSLSALLNVEPADATKTANTANLTISALAKRPILHPGELETGSYGGINYYKMSCERVLEGEVGNITTVVFRVRMYNETDEASLFILLADKRAIGPACLWEGTITYAFSRAFAEAWKDFLEQVNLTDETFTKYFVKAHFTSPVTGWGGTIIDVDVLNAIKTESQIRVDFRIFIDKEKFVKGLMTWLGRGLGVHGLPERELTANESIALFDELFSRPRAGPISFALTGFHNATVYDFKGSVRAPREDLSKALILTSIFTEMWWRYAHATRFTLNPWSLLGVLSSAFQGLELKSGGELHVSLEEMKNVIPTTTLYKVDLKTPRVVKKGAVTPAETLKVLSDMTAILLLRSPALDNVTLSVFPEEGVKVKLGGSEVKEVAFKDLGSLRVTFATALTLSAEPSAVEVGGEVVIRGKIEPAMSAPITISVMVPDGCEGSYCVLKTIDATTGKDGSFSASIRLEKAGSYTITASYAGSELYEPSTASTVVEVKAPPAPLLVPEALWYVIAIVVAVVGIIIAVIKAPRSVRRP